MATFVQKEILLDEMYNSTKKIMLDKVSADEEFPEEWQKDRKMLENFKRELAKKTPENINFDEAINFYKAIKTKYELMPNKQQLRFKMNSTNNTLANFSELEKNNAIKKLWNDIKKSSCTITEYKLYKLSQKSLYSRNYKYHKSLNQPRNL